MFGEARADRRINIPRAAHRQHLGGAVSERLQMRKMRKKFLAACRGSGFASARQRDGRRRETLLASCSGAARTPLAHPRRRRTPLGRRSSTDGGNPGWGPPRHGIQDPARADDRWPLSGLGRPPSDNHRPPLTPADLRRPTLAVRRRSARIPLALRRPPPTSSDLRRPQSTTADADDLWPPAGLRQPPPATANHRRPPLTSADHRQRPMPPAGVRRRPLASRRRPLASRRPSPVRSIVNSLQHRCCD